MKRVYGILGRGNSSMLGESLNFLNCSFLKFELKYKKNILFLIIRAYIFVDFGIPKNEVSICESAL